MAQSLELQAQIQIWQQRAADGTMTQEEYKKVILALRQERRGAAEASAGARKKKAAAAVPVPDADDLLSELGG